MNDSTIWIADSIWRSNLANLTGILFGGSVLVILYVLRMSLNSSFPSGRRRMTYPKLPPKSSVTSMGQTNLSLGAPSEAFLLRFSLNSTLDLILREVYHLRACLDPL